MGRLKLRRLIPFTCLLALALSALGCGGTAGRTDTPAALGGASNAAAPESLDVPDPADTAIPGAVEIAALPAPDGVEAGVWAELTAELRRVLVEYQPESKAISAPPEGDAGLVELSYYEPTSTLRWLYVSLGDYDQNGIVGVSDLTPLGVHFGEESPDGAGQPFPAESLGAAIDGNGDGLIGVSDIAPIGQNFGRRVAGYNLYVATGAVSPPAEAQHPNPAGSTWLGEIGLAEGDATAGRRRFYRQVVPTQDEQYYWVRPYDGDDEGWASNGVHVKLPPPQPPLASLKVSGSTKTLAHIVWDAAGSLDPDGEIVKYEWDFDGDGVFEYDSGTDAKVDFYYYEAGDYGCTVRVTDGDAKTDVDSRSVQVTEEAQWHDTVADEIIKSKFDSLSNEAITQETLLEVEGRPAFTYSRLLDEYNEETSSYYVGAYLRADDEEGVSWPVPQFIPDSGGAGPALVVDGLPAVIIGLDKEYTSGPTWMEYWTYYTRAGDIEGASWPILKLIYHNRFSSEGEWDNPQLFIARFINVGSSPAIVGNFNNSLAEQQEVYLRAHNSTGSSWPSEFQIGETSNGYAFRSIENVGDSFSILKNINGEDLLYYRNKAVDDLAWSGSTLVDRLEHVGDLCFLLEVDGYPAAVYYDETQSTLKYRRALDPQGAAWADSIPLATEARDEFNAAVIDGRPTVVYRSRIDYEVKLIAANDSLGNLWGGPAVLSGFPDWEHMVVDLCQFKSIAQRPALAYRRVFSIDDQRDNQLRYWSYY
jgi:hypothetical protein